MSGWISRRVTAAPIRPRATDGFEFVGQRVGLRARIEVEQAFQLRDGRREAHGGHGLSGPGVGE